MPHSRRSLSDGSSISHESPAEYAQKDEEEAELDYLAPSRWWFISTMFPLLAATFGPVASGFNICALVGSWIDRTNASSDGTKETHSSDPGWLYTINALSLAVAIVGNLSLFAQMTARLRFAIAQPVTLVGYFGASFLLLGIVAAAPGKLQQPGQMLAQAFYYAAIAAVLYFIVGSLLLVTSYGVRIGKYSREYKLTMVQRSLMFQTTAFVSYLLASAAVYSHIEGWEYLDTVYFVDVTLFTIGFGDFAPETHLGRSLFFPFAVGGILFIGLIVASISACVLEAGSKKVTTRNLEKARRSIVQNMDPKSGGIRISWFQKRRNIASKDGSELAQREHEFNLMRLVQQKAAWQNSLLAFLFSFGMWLSIWLVGAAVFWQAEKGVGNWSYFEALYFTYVSYLTIGYGDFEPNSNSSKPAFVMWSLLALPTLTLLIGALGGVIAEFVNSITLWMAQNLPETIGILRNMKHSAQKKKMDKDGDYSAAKPSGFMEDGDGVMAQQPDAVRGMGGNVQAGNGATKEEKSSAHSFRPQLLLRQLKQVIEHLDASPPRKYTYSEWVWMLKLIGQDESDPRYHRQAQDVRAAESSDVDGSKQPGALEGDHPWSWLGDKSPLMSGLDEPQWVMRKLIAALDCELGKIGEQREKEHTP